MIDIEEAIAEYLIAKEDEERAKERRLLAGKRLRRYCLENGEFKTCTTFETGHLRMLVSASTDTHLTDDAPDYYHRGWRANVHSSFPKLKPNELRKALEDAGVSTYDTRKVKKKYVLAEAERLSGDVPGLFVYAQQKKQ
jgi:hypothetical protein